MQYSCKWDLHPNHFGCFNLAGMYNEGKGVRHDRVKAIELYKKACDAGDEKGCKNYRILKTPEPERK
jgi:TPR repeat protein